MACTQQLTMFPPTVPAAARKISFVPLVALFGRCSTAAAQTWLVIYEVIGTTDTPTCDGRDDGAAMRRITATIAEVFAAYSSSVRTSSDFIPPNFSVLDQNCRQVLLDGCNLICVIGMTFVNHAAQPPWGVHLISPITPCAHLACGVGCFQGYANAEAIKKNTPCSTGRTPCSTYGSSRITVSDRGSWGFISLNNASLGETSHGERGFLCACT